ncbi:hypothetical protein SORBI_3005G070901 [Sorghum bicolor]|uniref:Uncharacterized protein n=1 Tax=Sorghum bicolor TaxID=4558 RepID=A0A1Z5RHQ1_SORBI|nr:hypothetical protein SORBI_3005G070901 [Sorghum bicolor]
MSCSETSAAAHPAPSVQGRSSRLWTNRKYVRRDAARDGSTSRRFPRFALGSLARPARRSDAKPPSNEVRLFAGVLVGTKRREEVRFLVVT